MVSFIYHWLFVKLSIKIFISIRQLQIQTLKIGREKCDTVKILDTSLNFMKFKDHKANYHTHMAMSHAKGSDYVKAIKHNFL